jgi:ectoine hydroxylase-related dioxygenase (phytanoyl-CoA dioxygenase family)
VTETSTVTGIADALRQCGVTDTTLTAHEKNALDRDGYFLAPDVVDDDWLAGLRAAFETALAEGKRHGVHVHMPWQEPVFDGVYTHPKILAAVYHVLRRPFKSSGVVGRDPAPGHGQQALHADWMRTASEPFHLVTTLWLLDDYTPDNGATRLVPGSHRMPKALPKQMAQPESRHPEQKIVVATAGSVLIFNGHLLHSGTRNQSGRRRRVLQCPFVARDVPHLADAQPEIPERLPAAARYLLGEG